jgi:GNAT superfamily N-acetyltransferase
MRTPLRVGTSRVIRIAQADSSEQVRAVAELFVEYAASLAVDLSFQRFDDELATLPGDYVPPRGALLLAFDEDEAVGCAGLRPLEWPRTSELKRLYVRPQSRGRGTGKLLSQAALSTAAAPGYRRLRLDTLSTMTEAQHLYEALGFHEIDAYRFNPVPGARYLEMDLRESER